MTIEVLQAMTTYQQLVHLPTASSIMASTTVTANDLNTYHRNRVDIDSNIRQFWDSFPCPPPWRPSLLTEVNTSKLGPQLGESVKNFLVGKCQLEAVMPAIYQRPGWNDDEVNNSPGSRGSDHHHTTNSSSEHTWCNKTCQLAVGCSGVFVAMFIVVLVLVCLNRSRRSNKMPSTRPSRQQLQMSTSTSDPINWAEFSNAQVQFDDDMIYPPFRHRDLPSPPSQCHHPSCDPKWTCPNGSSFHPLVRMSPSSTTYCTHGYTAVYEKIDDEDDEVDDRVPCNHNVRSFGTGERTANLQNNSRNTLQSGVPFLPESQPAADRRRAEEETGFNGENFPVSILPRYFELDVTHPNANPNPNLNSTTNSALDDQTNFKNVNSTQNNSAWNQRNELCFKPFQVHSAFLNNPSVCNQLCATCVSSVVSIAPPPCLNTHRQNGFVPNVNTFNHIIPTTSVVTANPNGPSNIISGYHPPNTTSFRPFSHKPEQPLPCLNDSNLVENNPPPYTDQGCDLRHRNTFNPDFNDSPFPPHGNNHRPSPKNLAGIKPEDCSQNVGHHTCHMTQNSSPIGSPCRQWCPTCQQVPLLNGEGEPSQFHSASFRPKPYINLPRQHSKYRRICSPDNTSVQTDNKSLPENDSDEENTGSSSNISALKNDDGNLKKLGGYLSPSGQSFHDQLWTNTTTDSGLEEEPRGGPLVEIRQGEGEGVGGDNVLCEDLPKPVLSLHSHYFNKTSPA